jgi:ribosomal protein S18 acetylase RimI-like enzyme
MSLPKDERMRMLAVLAQVENRRKALMPEPHWYVSAVGVDPVHQGKAFGSALIGHGISRADRSGTPISLETEVQDNVGFYQGHGFEVLEVLELDGIDIPMWLMARSAD